jgi:hypothetical protein
MVGTNTRYEASLVNTILRKQQLTKALTYLTIGSYSNLTLMQTHEGNGLRSLIAYTENKISTASLCYLNKNSSIFYSFLNNTIKNGYLLQNIVRFLGKKFFSKTKSGERLGILHSNISSLNIAHLGITSGVRSPFHSQQHADKQLETLFTVQTHNFKIQK